MEAAAKTISSTGSSFSSAKAAEARANVRQRARISASNFFICGSPSSNINNLQFAFYCNSKYSIEQTVLQGKTIEKLNKYINTINLNNNYYTISNIRRKLFKSIIDELGGLRFAISGAAAIDKNVQRDFNDFGILTVSGYGLTETSPVLTCENEKFLRPGSIGKALYGVDVKIFEPDEEGIGEIIAKGPNVMKGYYENEEATKAVLKDGWFHTGDLGYMDKDGFFYISGRKKNVIVLKNGKNIYPEEIEILVGRLPYVAENIVFGIPKDDDYMLSAKIVYNKDYVKEEYPNLSEEGLKNKIWEDIKEINSKLPNYKHIKNIIVTDEPMIKTSTGKVKRNEEMNHLVTHP